jgi:cytoskeletal protein RodZ
MKKGNFGEALRREREMRGVSLEEVSNATRISTRFLLALENEQWHELPGGVFNRGFVRSVSRFLGLDEDALIAEYALVTNDKPELAVWATGEKPRSSVVPIVLALIVLALAVGGYFAWHQASPWLAPRIAALWDRATGSQSSGVASADQSQTAAPSQPTATAPAAAVSAATGELELKLEAGKSTTVTVLADGISQFDGRIEKDAKHTFRAREKFEITARDPSALVVTLNGQEVPPFGFPGQPGSKTLTRADLKPGGQP